MQFINPLVLLGLVAVIIPIAVHLFNFRKYRKLYFSNVQFLRELKQQSKKQSNLLHRLILLTRILAFTFIVLAFAQPFFAAGDRAISSASNVISVFVDNSFSMEASGQRGTLLDEAKVKAREIAEAYSQDDLFQLLTNDFEGKHQRLVSRDEFTTMLNEIVISPSSRSLSEINSRQEDLLRTQLKANTQTYLISDFQKSTIMKSIPDSSLKGFLIPVKATTRNNVYIDSCWFSNPVLQVNEQATLNVKLKNVSDTKLEKIPVRLKINDSQRSLASVDIEAGGITELTFTFSNGQPGYYSGTIEINDFPVTYDDIYYFVFRISNSIPVLCINNDKPDPYINSVFAVDSIIQLTNSSIRQVDFSGFSSHRLIILNKLGSLSSGMIQELVKYVENGGNIAVIPTLDTTINPINQLLSRLGPEVYTSLVKEPVKLSKINARHPLYKDVFEKGALDAENLNMPLIGQYYNLPVSSSSTSETLLELSNGQPYLTVATVGMGKAFLFTSNFNDDNGNFARHALFVPTMLNMAFQSEKIAPLMYQNDYAGPISIDNYYINGDKMPKLKHESSGYEFIPQVKQSGGQNFLFINNQVTQSGIYRVQSDGNSDELIAFNYNRLESNMEVATDKDMEVVDENTNLTVLETNQKPLNKIIQEQGKKNNIWKWFILAALLSLLAEVLLISLASKLKSKDTMPGIS